MVSIRRAAAISATFAVVLAACSPSGDEGSPAGRGRRDCHVGVAWATFQEERYGLRDKPGIEAALEAAGAPAHRQRRGKLGGDAGIERRGTARRRHRRAHPELREPESSLQSVQAALDAGIPVIAYDRELESADALFMTHDNVGVGRMIAEAVTAAQPTGNYAIIKGQEGQTNPLFLREGFEEVIAPLIAAGDITIPEGAEVYTDEWLPDNAQDNMENDPDRERQRHPGRSRAERRDGRRCHRGARRPGPRW